MSEFRDRYGDPVEVPEGHKHAWVDTELRCDDCGSHPGAECSGCDAVVEYASEDDPPDPDDTGCGLQGEQAILSGGIGPEVAGVAVEHSIEDPFTGEITVRFILGEIGPSGIIRLTVD